MIYREVSNSSLKSFLKCRSFGGIGGLQRCPESVEKLVIHADALVVVCCHFSSHRANHIGSSEHYSRDEQLGGAGDGTPNIELIITLISHHIARLKAVIMHSRKGSQASAQTGTSIARSRTYCLKEEKQMAEARRGWRFELGLSPEVRQANALEYMAHYLDRIDLQLTRIATVAEKIEMTLKATAQRR